MLSRGFFSLLSLFFLHLAVYGQDLVFKSNVQGGIGQSLLGISLKLGQKATSEYEVKVGPVYSASYTYFFTHWFSLGAAASTQTLDLVYFVDEGNEIREVGVEVKRLNIALKPLIHYYNKGNIDVYSGLRVGMSNWSFQFLSDDDAVDQMAFLNEPIVLFGPNSFFRNSENKLIHKATLPSVQLVCLGVFGYFKSNIGLGGEFGLGSPYVCSAYISIRF